MSNTVPSGCEVLINSAPIFVFFFYSSTVVITNITSLSSDCLCLPEVKQCKCESNNCKSECNNILDLPLYILFYSISKQLINARS